MSVDGTDCRIREPAPFDSKWYSHKFKGAGLRYEIGLSISSGSIVWVHGPFACGAFPDVSIFRLGMKSALSPDEKVIGDKGYRDEKCEKPPAIDDPNKRTYAIIRARHETVNSRFKNFRVLSDTFRHDISLHGVCFHAVANISHIMTKLGNPLFELNL